MTVTFLTGFEGRQAEVDGIALSGTAAYSTAQHRTGAASLRCNPASGASGFAQITTESSGYHHVAVYVATMPSVARSILGYGPRVTVELNSDGTLSVYDYYGALIGTSSTALQTGQWYWIGWFGGIGTNVPYLQINGTTEVTGTNANSTANVYWGCVGTEASAIDIYYDDIIESDGFLAPSNVSLLLPVSDDANLSSLWKLGGGTNTTNLYVPVSTLPPPGVASASENDTTNIECADRNSANGYRATCETYASAGIVAADTILAIQAFFQHGEDINTGTKTGYFQFYSNPSWGSPGGITFGGDVGAHGTSPTNWAVSRSLIGPTTVTLSSGPVLSVAKNDSTTRLGCVDSMGVYVAWTPASTGGTIAPSAIASAEAFGTSTIAKGGVNVQPSAISSAEAIGAHTLSVFIPSSTISPTAIASAEAFGAVTVLHGTALISPSAIASAGAFGSVTLLKGNVNIAPSAIASAEVFGTAVLLKTSTIAPTSIGSAEAVGSATLIHGGVIITPSGITSSESVGTPNLGLPAATVLPTAIATAESVGSPTLIKGAVSIAPTAIPSTEAFGTIVLVPGGVIISVTTGGTVAQDSFTQSGTGLADLATHTPELGGAWSAFLASGGWSIDRDNDKASQSITSLYQLASAVVADGELYAEVTCVGAYVGLAFRLTGTNNAYLVTAVNNADSWGQEFVISRMTGGSVVSITGYDLTGQVSDLGALSLRVEVSGQSPTRIRAKAWETGGGEPGSWLLDTTDNTAGNQVSSGPVGIYGDFLDVGGTVDNLLITGLVGAGIASGEVVGNPTLATGGTPSTITATGIGTAEAVGTPTLKPIATILSSAIASAEVFGTATLRPGSVVIQPNGIASAEVVSTPALVSGAGMVLPAGIASAEAIGNPTLVAGGVTIAPTAISSAQAFGTAILKPTSIIAPVAIASAEVFGNRTRLNPVRVTSIDSAEAFGTPILVAGVPGAQTILPSAISSAEAVGNPTLLHGGVVIAPSSIASGEALGAATLASTARIVPAAISSQEAVSQPVLQALASISPTSVGSGEALGQPTIRPGLVVISPQGVVSGEILGDPFFSSGQTVVRPTGITSGELFGLPELIYFSAIIPEGIASSEVFGFPELIPGVTFILPTAIDSAELVGVPILTGSRASWRWLNRAQNWMTTRGARDPDVQDGFARTRKDEGDT